MSFAALADAHLDAAYRLARWLTRDPVLAEDVVQDAMLRALKYFAGFRGDNERAWLLTIVRNVAMSRLQSQRAAPVSLDAMQNTGVPAEPGSTEHFAEPADPGAGPEETLHQSEEQRVVSECLAQLPAELRECLVLREWEDLSYKEIARIVDAPIGTVMSRLWRARQQLATALAAAMEQ